MSLLPTDRKPLMLAPMQGVTNDALRGWFIAKVKPDLVFTEFVRAQNQSRKRVARQELAEIVAHSGPVPLVVQLIGNNPEALREAALQVQDAGCSDLNLNLGCPYGRMTHGASGGELLRFPERLVALLRSLRSVIKGSFSIKCRAGYDDPRQIFDLLPLYEEAGIDYLILHPRTVVQKYSGAADHQLTRQVAAASRLPVIANGDINDSLQGRQLLDGANVAGLMLGRGALNDPQLFTRLRGDAGACPTGTARRQELGSYLTEIFILYLDKFAGERQALFKIKDLLSFIRDPDLQREIGKLKRATSLDRFVLLLNRLSQKD